MNFHKTRGILLLSTLIILFSCRGKKDEALNVNINAAYETDPPIAEDVIVKKIKGDGKHVLLMARFSKDVLKEKFLAFHYDTSKLVIRDDGMGDDETANDGLYSAKLDMDANELEQQFADMQKRSAGTKRFVFRGRSVISDSPKEIFDIEKFRRGDTVSLRGLPGLPPPASLKDHSLMITDLNVVEDPTRTFNYCTQTGNIDGPWSFKTLMKELAKTSPADVVTDEELVNFIIHFFHTWSNDQTINGESIHHRILVDRAIQSWASRSQTLPPPRVPNGHIDIRAIPFKLTAIVNRIDLRGNSGYGFSNAGELRFVFCMMSPNGCSASSANIIFEFGVPKTGCAEVKQYAQDWYDLNGIAFTDPQFNTKLQAITDQVTPSGSNPSKPNQSALNQVRFNERAFAEFTWELREFHLSNTTHLLEPAPTKQTPANIYNVKTDNADVRRLADYINTHESQILANHYTVPTSYSGSPFLDGHDFVGAPPFTLPPTRPVGPVSGVAPQHWDGTVSAGLSFINNNDVRQVFSLNTCGGCHSGETQTAFTMINPVAYGTQATLSGFLTGTPGIADGSNLPVDLDGDNGIMNVPDPAGRASSNNLRQFNDLQRRANELQDFVSSFFSCKSIFVIKETLLRRPPVWVH